MWTCDTCSRRSGRSLGASVALLAVCAAAQAPESGAGPGRLDDVLARVGERIERYFARAQSIIFVEKTTIQHIATNMTPQGFARVLESDVRVEAYPSDGDGDGTSETKVVRDVRKVNGHPRRATEDQNTCLDPNPVSPEPLAFLLPAQRGQYEFTWAGPGKGKDRTSVMIDFRELGSGKPEVKERTDKGDGCFSIDIPGRARGRVWIDASSYDVRRVDQRIAGLIDFRLPPNPKRQILGLDAAPILERLDMSIRYKTVPFDNPEEIVLLPESIDTLMVVRGMQSYRMRQVFSGYRRFVTAGRLVK